jgi:hypothetical protein
VPGREKIHEEGRKKGTEERSLKRQDSRGREFQKEQLRSNLVLKEERWRRTISLLNQLDGLDIFISSEAASYFQS